MPRAKKPQVAPGETYGKGQELEQLAASAPAAGPSQMDPAMLQELANAGARQMDPGPPGGLLPQPSARPNEPITAGMPMGAGPGPEAIPQMRMAQNKTVAQLSQAAQMTGNPRLAEMARRAQRLIGRKLPRGKPF